MKTLGMWVIIMITLGYSNSYAQKSMKVDRIKNLTDQRLALHLTYDDDLQDICFDSKTILELAKQGKLELSSRQIKGRYEDFGLYYRPCYKKEMLYLSNGRVSYESASIEWGERIFVWWFIFALLSIIVIVLAQITRKKILLILGALLALVYIILSSTIILHSFGSIGMLAKWIGVGCVLYFALMILTINPDHSSDDASIIDKNDSEVPPKIFVFVFFLVLVGFIVYLNINNSAIAISCMSVSFLSLCFLIGYKLDKKKQRDIYLSSLYLFYLFILLGMVLTYFQI